MNEEILNKNINMKIREYPQMLIGQLLFTEKPEPCPVERAREILEKYAGKLGETAKKDSPENVVCAFPVEKYKCSFNDDAEAMSPMACFSSPIEISLDLDELETSQLWDFENGADFVNNQVKYEVITNALLSTGLDYTEQAELFLAQLDAAVEMYPTAKAVYVPSSGKLTSIETFKFDRQWKMSVRFIRAAVNVRFFTITDSNDMLIDSLGMYAFLLPDVQVHFHGLDPNYVAQYVYNILDYQFNNDFPIDNGDGLDCFDENDDQRDNTQWRAWFEESLIQPLRPVLDVYCGKNAAGPRNY